MANPQKTVWRVVALAAVILTLFVGAANAAVKIPHCAIHNVVLSNGLRVLMLEEHDSPVIGVQVWYHVGAKDEPPGKTGFAHLFEHLMFDGTKNLGPEQFSDYIVRSGGVDNAYTTEDTTVYWETVPSTNLPVVLWLEADRMRNLQINEQIFKTEREVVKEERRLRFDNQPYGSVVETLYRAAFTVHPYRHQTIGSMDDLERASVEDIQHFYDTYYVPSNATLVIVGDFKTSEAESLAEKYFGPLPSGDAPINRAIPREPPQTARRVVKLDLDVALPAFVEAYHMPADGTADAYPLRLAAKILSEGESSRIYHRLVYEKQIALDAQSTGNFTEDPNLFFVLAILSPGHTPAEGEREMDAELEHLKNEPVPPEELDKAKNQILRDFIVSRETVKTRGEELGYDSVILKNAELVNTEWARFLAVTPGDIQRVAKKYFAPENATIVEVFPRTNQASKSGD
ncbi:MAG TPA: pitrilysin family protein [Terriglobia bacterium]|nr:pitrilysin family protein [Terriglobia bacterium]